MTGFLHWKKAASENDIIFTQPASLSNCLATSLSITRIILTIRTGIKENSGWFWIITGIEKVNEFIFGIATGDIILRRDCKSRRAGKNYYDPVSLQ
jgi:hypothetical protein